MSDAPAAHDGVSVNAKTSGGDGKAMEVEDEGSGGAQGGKSAGAAGGAAAGSTFELPWCVGVEMKEMAGKKREREGKWVI